MLFGPLGDRFGKLRVIALAAALTLTIVLLSLAAFASAASMRVTDAMLPRLASQFHVGLAQAASVITVFAVAYGLMRMR